MGGICSGVADVKMVKRGAFLEAIHLSRWCAIKNNEFLLTLIVRPFRFFSDFQRDI